MTNRTITNQTIFSTNWAKTDRRSVHAGLSGRGDCRVIWWQLNCRMQQMLRPTVTLEEMMFTFHSRHHSITFFFLKLRLDVNEVAAVIQTHGIVAAIRTAASLD